MTSLMRKYYKAWLNTTTLLGHPQDVDKFYRFVKACVRYGRTRRCGEWLRPILEEDLANCFPDKEHAERLTDEAISIFDHIIEYEGISFPDPLVELKSVYAVENAYRRVLNPDGSRFYSDEDIEKFLDKHFGEQRERTF